MITLELFVAVLITAVSQLRQGGKGVLMQPSVEFFPQHMGQVCFNCQQLAWKRSC